MSEHTDPILFEVDISDPVDNPRQRIAVVGSNDQAPMEPDIDPVTTAAILLKSRAIRMEHVRDDHAGFDDISWHILLDLMVSKNAGKPVMMDDLVTTHRVAKGVMSRYVAYLIGIGMIRKNPVAVDDENAQLVLTASGADLAGSALGEIGRQLPSFAGSHVPNI